MCRGGSVLLSRSAGCRSDCDAIVAAALMPVPGLGVRPAPMGLRFTVAFSGIAGGITRHREGEMPVDEVLRRVLGLVLRGRIGDSAMYVAASSSGSVTSATECKLV